MLASFFTNVPTVERYLNRKKEIVAFFAHTAQKNVLPSRKGALAIVVDREMRVEKDSNIPAAK